MKRKPKPRCPICKRLAKPHPTCEMDPACVNGLLECSRCNSIFSRYAATAAEETSAASTPGDDAVSRVPNLPVLLAGLSAGTWVVLNPSMSRVLASGRTLAAAMRKAKISPVTSTRAVGNLPVTLQVPWKPSMISSTGWTRACARVRGIYWCWDDRDDTTPFPCFLLSGRLPPVPWRSAQPIWRGEPPQPPPTAKKVAKQ